MQYFHFKFIYELHQQQIKFFFIIYVVYCNKAISIYF